MITETRFASSHHGFWHELLPMAESYLRGCNAGLARFAKPLSSSLPAATRGLVNELSFRVFAESVAQGIEPHSLPLDEIDRQAEAARAFIEGFRQHGRAPLPPLPVEAKTEAVVLADRTLSFFARAALPVAFSVRPSFPGCGWISRCEGDVLSQSTLFELKSGERSFRSTDVRQVLIYCALAFVSKSTEVDRVCWVNPRHGVYFSESLTDLCAMLSGRSPNEVLSDIVEYASESEHYDSV